MSDKPFGLAVRAIIRNKNGDCLLLRRSDTCRSFVGTWEWPGGKVDPGETFDVAVLREVAEETGLEIRLTGVAGAFSFELPHIHVAMLCLEASLINDDRVRLSEEHDQFEWVPLVDLLQRELANGLGHFARQYVQRLTDGD